MANPRQQLLQLERRLLATLVVHADSELIEKVLTFVSEADFVSDHHRQIFDACVKASREFGACSPPSVIAFLDSRTASIVATLVNQVIALDSDEAPRIDEIQALWAKHQKIKTLLEVESEIRRFLDGGVEIDADEFLKSLQVQLSAVQAVASAPSAIDLTPLWNSGEPKAITGIDELDKMLHPVNPGDIFIIAGRTSIGKTALALQMAANLALNNEAVLFISLEMRAEQVISRVLAHLGFMREYEIRNPKYLVSVSEKEKVVRGAKTIGIELTQLGSQLALANAILLRLKFFIVDGTRSISAISAAKVAEMILQYKPSWVFIDYLHLMELPTRESLSAEGLHALIRALKTIAIQHGVRIVGLSQINRQAELDRVTLENLYYSSGIAHTASQVLIVKEKRAEDRHSDIRRLTLSLEKNRNGRTGSVEAIFIRPLMRFVSDPEQL